MKRKHMDSATWFAMDKAMEAEARKSRPTVMTPVRADPLAFGDANFSDPGSNHGPSILNPKVYEALRKKGMSKSQAAAISNAQLNK